jgi:hypothetical protein
MPGHGEPRAKREAQQQSEFETVAGAHRWPTCSIARRRMQRNARSSNELTSIDAGGRRLRRGPIDPDEPRTNTSSSRRSPRHSLAERSRPTEVRSCLRRQRSTSTARFVSDAAVPRTRDTRDAVARARRRLC